MPSFVSSGRLVIAVSILTALMLILPAVSHSEPFDIMIFPLSIRAAGMGETGTADHRDLANLAYNPAAIAMFDGFQATWSHSELPYPMTDVHLDGYLAGGGRRWRLNESMTISGGMAAHYAKEKYGYPGSDFQPLDRDPYHRSYGAGAGVAFGYEHIIYIGTGLNLKRWKWDNNEETQNRQILEATVFDAGITATAAVLRKDGYTIETAIGFAYSNFGGSITTTQLPVYMPPFDDFPTPEYRRYGMSVQFTSPSRSWIDELFQTELPAVSAAFNYDIIDDAFESYYAGNRRALGGEIGAFDMLFLRMGRISLDEENIESPSGKTTFTDTTYGIGIAVTYQRYHFRFDYARRHIDNVDINQTRYSLLLDVGL